MVQRMVRQGVKGVVDAQNWESFNRVLHVTPYNTHRGVVIEISSLYDDPIAEPTEPPNDSALIRYLLPAALYRIAIGPPGFLNVRDVGVVAVAGIRTVPNPDWGENLVRDL